MFETFTGSALNLPDCELLAFAKIPGEVRAVESELFGLKWFDYRHMHPTKATYQFAHAYSKIVRALFAEQKDRDKAEKVTAFFPTDIFKNRELLATTAARQAFDRLGVRYEFAINFILRRNVERGWRVFARPNQIYGEETLLDMLDAWKVERDARLQIPLNPRFKVENFTGHPDQFAWEQYAVKQIDTREHKDKAMGSLFNAGVLRLQAATVSFPAQTVRDGQRFAKLLAG